MQDEELKFEDKAPQAAGKIHSDFERGFIRASVVAYDDFAACDFSMAAVKAKGLQRTEGKEYVVLLPADEDADEVEILELAELDDEMEEYRSIEDTAILEAVFEIFKEKFKDEFNFED